jgi:hypothetical protein
VRFADDVTEHYQSRWSDRDYKVARRGPWMHYAADRHRFQRRIREFEDNFSYILTDYHRNLIRTLIDDFNMHDLSANLHVLLL